MAAPLLSTTPNEQPNYFIITATQVAEEKEEGMIRKEGETSRRRGTHGEEDTKREEIKGNS